MTSGAEVRACALKHSFSVLDAVWDGCGRGFPALELRNSAIELINSVTEKVFSVIEKVFSVAEKVSSVTELGSSVTEKGSSTAERAVSKTEPTSPQAALGVFLMQKWFYGLEFSALACSDIIGGTGVLSSVRDCFKA